MRKLALTAAAVALALLAGCGEKSGPTGSPDEVLAAAKKSLDDTPGVTMELAAQGALPSGVSTGVKSAKGTLTHQPGFEGTITAIVSGFSANIPVIAVDGLVYADVPLLPGGMQEINPDDYDVPDPTGLADPDTGVSAWLTAIRGAKKSGQTRDGDLVLTKYSGTLSGDLIEPVLPTADPSGTFATDLGIDKDGLLRVATITGPVYKGKTDITYKVTITGYGITDQITAP